MKQTGSFRIITLVVVGFALYYALFLNFQSIKNMLDEWTKHGLTSYVLTYALIGIPIFIGTKLIDRKSGIVRSLGLASNSLRGVWTSALFAVPMLIGSLLFFTFNQNLDINKLIAGTIIAGFMEELYYRGFLFGQVFRHTRYGFIPSILFGALIFAFGHLYQGQNMGQLVGIFMITFSGAIFFAWLYVEWNYNLWVPIWTHTFMNLIWALFEIDQMALGDVKANIFRGLTIMTAIVFTIAYKLYKGHKFAINRKTIMIKADFDWSKK